MTIEQELAIYKNMVRLYKYDELTGMKMRHDFQHEAIHYMSAQKFYLTMYDITGLHAVNRSEGGIEAGDALIRQVASDIKHMDGLWECYRIGGDEFMMLTFEMPTNPEIKNASHATVFSGSHDSLSSMISVVDAKLTDVKVALSRRRETDG